MALDARPVPGDVTEPDILSPADPSNLGLFALPIHPEDREHIHAGLIIGVDHDPDDGPPTQCTNYSGRPFPGCYNGHEGTDFMVWGGFETIDRVDVRVVAAASGVVTKTVDGHYDRCHGDLSDFDVDCDGHQMVANRVHLRHADGKTSRYLHLKRGSVSVTEGEYVPCGTVLGLVGSSGRSVAPHLHFELYDDTGERLDPYAGEVSQAMSFWVGQSTPDGLPSQECGPWPQAVPRHGVFSRVIREPVHTVTEDEGRSSMSVLPGDRTCAHTWP